MRALLILISFLLVGCNTKPPTYLVCDNMDNQNDIVGRRWIVLDHANDLWITSVMYVEPITFDFDRTADEFEQIISRDRELDKSWLNVWDLKKNDDYYYYGDPEIDNFKLNRKTLIFRSYIDRFQCLVLDDLSYMQSLGAEKAKEGLKENTNKI